MNSKKTKLFLLKELAYYGCEEVASYEKIVYRGKYWYIIVSYEENQKETHLFIGSTRLRREYLLMEMKGKRLSVKGWGIRPITTIPKHIRDRVSILRKMRRLL
jgi:hypothetical protein